MDHSKQNVAVLFAHKHLKLDISRRTEVINEGVLTFTLEKKEVHAFKKRMIINMIGKYKKHSLH